MPTRISLMITCLGDALFPAVGVASVKLLRRLGVEVDFPAAQTCCGQPHFNSGYHDLARDLASRAMKGWPQVFLEQPPWIFAFVGASVVAPHVPSLWQSEGDGGF